jgi:hypothetical protein
VRIAPPLAVALVLGACHSSDDPQFVDAAPDAPLIDASLIDAPVGTVFDITGSFLLAIRAGFEANNDPAFYVQFVTVWQLQTDPFRLFANHGALCTAAACAERSVVTTFDNGKTFVTENGEFQQSITGTLGGMANPFTGTSIPIDAVLHARIISTDLVCGTVTGTSNGLDLAGSTFAAIRVTDTTPSNLPAPVAACPGL